MSLPRDRMGDTSSKDALSPVLPDEITRLIEPRTSEIVGVMHGCVCPACEAVRNELKAAILAYGATQREEALTVAVRAVYADYMGKEISDEGLEEYLRALRGERP